MEEVQHLYGNPLEISNFGGSGDVDVDVPKLEELLTQDSVAKKNNCFFGSLGRVMAT